MSSKLIDSHTAWRENGMETTGFLDDADYSEKESFHTATHRANRSSCMGLMIHVGLITLYSILFLIAMLRTSSCGTSNHDLVRNTIKSPASVAINYEPKIFTTDMKTAREYFGEPSEEIEAAWERLLAPSTIRLSPADMARLERQNGIRLPDGDYLGGLNVFHDLHCLRRVTRLLYESHYFPNITAETKEMNLIHAQHCMDRLRQTVQCRGDVSLNTLMWGKRQSIPLGNLSSQHECVNWDTLYEWSYEKKVDVFQPGLLVHPTLGPAYANLENMPFTGAVKDTPL